MGIVLVGYTTRYRTFTPAQVEATYKKIADLGYNGPENLLGRRAGISVEDDLALLKKYGLTVVDVGGGDLDKPDEVKKNADKAGVHLIGCPSIPGDMMCSVDGFKAYAERINTWAKGLKSGGYKLNYHNHAQEFRNFPELDGKNGLSILIEETDPEVVCFEIDTHWTASGGGDPAYWIRKVKGRIPIVHYKDYAFDWKAEDVGLGQVYKRFAEVGQGNLNWPEITAAAREAGVQWYGVEQDRTQQVDEFTSLKMSIDFMRNKLGIK
jgi:sugar phosphate isomerase/epimerase